MNHWAFIAAAYGLTLAASMAVAVSSWVAMRRAEKAAELLKRS